MSRNRTWEICTLWNENDVAIARDPVGIVVDAPDEETAIALAMGRGLRDLISGLGFRADYLGVGAREVLS